MKYRIVPYGRLSWGVQRSRFGIFWITEDVFDSEPDAESHINLQLSWRASEAKTISEAKRRRRDIVPRRFP